MTRQEKLKAAYNHLRNCGRVHTQKAFGEAIDKREGTMSKAFNGVETALTDNLFTDICNAFPGTFNLEWFLDDDYNGDMLMNHGTQPTGFVADQQHDTPEQQKSIIDLYAGLIQQLERLRAETVSELTEVRTMKNELIVARDELKSAKRDLVFMLEKLSKEFGHQSDNSPLMAAEDTTKPKAD